MSYGTHRRTKLTAPEMISRSRDVVENRRLNLPHLYLALPLVRSNFAYISGIRKLESLG